MTSFRGTTTEIETLTGIKLKITMDESGRAEYFVNEKPVMKWSYEFNEKNFEERLVYTAFATIKSKDGKYHI